MNKDSLHLSSLVDTVRHGAINNRTKYQINIMLYPIPYSVLIACTQMFTLHFNLSQSFDFSRNAVLSVCFSFHNHCTAHIFLITFNLLTSRCGYIMPCLLFPSIFVLRLHLIQTIVVQASVVSISHTSTSTLFHSVSVWDWVELFFSLLAQMLFY